MINKLREIHTGVERGNVALGMTADRAPVGQHELLCKYCSQLTNSSYPLFSVLYGLFFGIILA